jgi:hypothetical protein
MIVHLPLLADAAPDLIRQRLARLDAGGDVGEQRHLPPQTPKQALDPLPGPQRAGNIEQIWRLKDRSARGVPCKWAHIVHAPQRQTTVRIQQMASLSGLLQPLPDCYEYGGWL